ncbi:LAME_0E04566g1_1 [Lachancea meyersii CBS 8951]|uniref:LAME_0E04566g1_1 n=1 Tax=Lachancea meyersii CBS 8951 TaxID=1266667 RepID=A0A1G4JGW8_9SACH|nr:LAME_0E04566g1_1 [Lachancea meyersii CBS 8951]
MMRDLGTLTTIEDLRQVKQLAQEIEKERESLADQLKVKTAKNETVLDEFDLVEKQLHLAAKDIVSARNSTDIAKLRAQYGSLVILDQIDALLAQRAAKTAQKAALEQVERTLDAIKSAASEKNVTDLQLELWHVDLKASQAQLPSQDVAPVFEIYNTLLQQQASPLIQKLESGLLNSSWDQTHGGVNPAASSVLASSFRDLSSRIYRLNALWLPQRRPGNLWNFECIANNFKIKFIYHLVNESMQKPHSVEMHFKFLDKYLDQNLYRCVDIFHDPTTPDLNKNFVHQQFINHVLAPIREKVNTTLVKIVNGASNENLKTLVVLISQIFIIDNALVKKHLYDGLGLIAMAPEEVLNTWLSFEIDSSISQFYKITNYTSLEKSGADFAKLLENLYLYFEPFFSVEYAKIMDYKLKTTREIFLKLPQNYRDTLLNSKDETVATDSELTQYEKTLWKARNLQLIRTTLENFGDKSIFFQLTEYLNAATSSSYETVFDDVLNLYEDAIVAAKESVIHRYKKLMNVAFRNYFKVSDWNQINSEPQQCSAELVSPLNLSNKLVSMMERSDLTPDVILAIKSEILNILIHYMIDYVINLNKFNKFGLDQLHLDFKALKDSLSFPYSSIPQNAEEGAFLETLQILALKYREDSNCEEFLSKVYINHRQFSGLRDKLSIEYSSDSELANALYRNL